MTHRYARRKERKTDRHPMPSYNLPRTSPYCRSCILMLLLHVMSRLLIDIAVGPRDCETLPDLHVRLGLCQQRVADVLLTACSPAVEALVAQRPDGHVALAGHELSSDGRRLCSNTVDVHLQLLAEGLERQIVDVVTKGVLDFATDGGETEDDVGGENSTRDGDPLKRGEQLEGQNHDVDPGDLGDGDGVGDGKRRVQHTVETDKAFVESDDTGDCSALAFKVQTCVFDLDLLAWFW